MNGDLLSLGVVRPLFPVPLVDAPGPGLLDLAPLGVRVPVGVLVPEGVCLPLVGVARPFIGVVGRLPPPGVVAPFLPGVLADEP